jgi:hypothetical protein
MRRPRSQGRFVRPPCAAARSCSRRVRRRPRVARRRLSRLSPPPTRGARCARDAQVAAWPSRASSRRSPSPPRRSSVGWASRRLFAARHRCGEHHCVPVARLSRAPSRLWARRRRARDPHALRPSRLLHWASRGSLVLLLTHCIGMSRCSFVSSMTDPLYSRPTYGTLGTSGVCSVSV